MTAITKLKKGRQAAVARYESEADIRSRRYRTMEAASMRLQKEAKGYLDSLRGKTGHRKLSNRS
jgi:hypothetical protein